MSNELSEDSYIGLADFFVFFFRRVNSSAENYVKKNLEVAQKT